MVGRPFRYRHRCEENVPPTPAVALPFRCPFTAVHCLSAVALPSHPAPAAGAGAGAVAGVSLVSCSRTTASSNRLTAGATPTPGTWKCSERSVKGREIATGRSEGSVEGSDRTTRGSEQGSGGSVKVSERTTRGSEQGSGEDNAPRSLPGRRRQSPPAAPSRRRASRRPPRPPPPDVTTTRSKSGHSAGGRSTSPQPEVIWAVFVGAQSVFDGPRALLTGRRWCANSTVVCPPALRSHAALPYGVTF